MNPVTAFLSRLANSGLRFHSRGKRMPAKPCTVAMSRAFSSWI
jgi:hypothetical protein